MRELYQTNLDNLSEESINCFSDFYSAIYQQLIENDRPYQGRLNPQKLLEKCDSFASSGVISLCIEEFRKPILKIKLHVLRIINDMIKYGDIEPAHVVNCTDFID